MKKDQYFGESEESICKIFKQWPNIRQTNVQTYTGTCPVSHEWCKRKRERGLSDRAGM